MDISIVKALPDDVVKALCNTLIHSLWQGLVLAAVAGLVVVCTRGATSAMRYNLLVASMLLFAGTTVYTFVGELHVAQIQVATGSADNNVNNGVIQQINIIAPIHQQVTFTENVVDYFNNHANLIVLIWLLVVCARSIQLLTGLNGLYHLKRKAIFKVDKEWQNRVYELSASLGIFRMISIAESGIAQVPMVIGHLKPIILIPVGLITALTPAEVDAILVHELAHIRRRDYLVNLLQSLMEIVFFFNPAVLWISNLIKAERENCCDDIAVEQTGSKANYIRALVSCQEYQISAPAYAMAFSGKKNHLLGRVKRMVSNSNQSLNMMEKSLLAICLLTATLVTTAFSNADKIDTLIKKTTKAIANVTVTIKPDAIVPTPDVNEPEATEPTITVDEVRPTVDTTRNLVVKADKLNQPQPILHTTALGKLQPDTLGRLERINTNINIAIQKEVTDMRVADSVNRRNNAVNAAIQREVKAAHTITLRADSTHRKNKLKALPPLPAATPAPPAPPAYAAQAQAYAKSKAAYDNQKATNEAQKDKIIADMIADGIITKDHADLSFKISTTEFIVNYKKQPDNIYQKYRAKYVRVLKNANGEWSWMYNYDSAKDKTTESIHTKEVN